MRLRNVKGSRETIAAHDKVIEIGTEYKGKWHELFGNDNPIHIEVGMGKGQFIMTLAKMHPEINYSALKNIQACLCVPLKNAVTTKATIFFLSVWMPKSLPMYLIKTKLTRFI